MGEMKFVDDDNITLIADRIRNKTGTSEPLEFPNGFVNAIDNISTDYQGDRFFELIYGEIIDE